jgi:hypothetical protein
MNRYILALIFGVVVAAVAVSIFWSLLPWITYRRAFRFVTAMIFSGAATTFFLAWRAHTREASAARARSRYLVGQGAGFVVLGVVWLLFSGWLLRR